MGKGLGPIDPKGYAMLCYANSFLFQQNFIDKTYLQVQYHSLLSCIDLTFYMKQFQNLTKMQI